MKGTESQNALRAIVLMVAAMAAFSIADTFIKLATVKLSSAYISLLMFAGSMVVFVSLAKYQGHRLLDRAAFSRVLVVRYIAEFAGAFGMFQSLRYVPLSTVGAVLQATPLVAAAGAVLLLGETVSWRRWSAIGGGFVGMLLILQPGTHSFDISALWAVLAMLALSTRDLTTRVTPGTMSTACLSAYTMIAGFPLAMIWVALSEPSLIPANANWWYVIGMIGFATAGYLMITSSLRIATVAAVSPFRYTRLLFLIVLGVVIFDEKPDALMLLGSLLIILSGLYAMWRETQVAQLTSSSKS